MALAEEIYKKAETLTVGEHVIRIFKTFDPDNKGYLEKK